MAPCITERSETACEGDEGGSDVQRKLRNSIIVTSIRMVVMLEEGGRLHIKMTKEKIS